MPDYFDPNASARASGYAHGQIDGKREGHKAGYAEGEEYGYKVGYDRGWNEAVQHANREMLQQLEYTRQHVAEKTELSQRSEAQQRLIKDLVSKLSAMEREKSNLKSENDELRSAVKSLHNANGQLQSQALQLDEKLKAMTKEYIDDRWQYNRCVVFMSSVRLVLEDLMTESAQQAEHLRMLFSKRYEQITEKALNEGTLRVPLHTDETLARNLPTVAAFMSKQLRNQRNQEAKE